MLTNFIKKVNIVRLVLDYWINLYNFIQSRIRADKQVGIILFNFLKSI